MLVLILFIISLYEEILMSLSNFLLPTITSIGLLSLIGCGESQNSAFIYTRVDEPASIITRDSNATMRPATPTLKNITLKLIQIVKTDVTHENQKEAITFTTETRYCDISGLRESEHQGDLTKIKKLEKFDRCKTTKYIQNGYLTFNYLELDSEGKYPKNVNITVNEDYTFDDILLKKGSKIESQISYTNDKKINTISIKANGVVTYQYGTYRLIEDEDNILF